MALKSYYGDIDIKGQESIDWSRPSLLIANHPNGFTEPILLATHLKPDLHFVTRSDVFIPKLKWFFKWTHQLPIYRFRDGFSGLRKNAEHLNACADVIVDGGNLVIFGEGSTLAGKRIRQMQKGSSRILQILKKRNVEQVQIVPVTLTYTHPLCWTGQVIIRLNKPLELDQYYTGRKFDEDRFIDELTVSLIKGGIHIEGAELLEKEEKFSILSATKHGFEKLATMIERISVIENDKEPEQHDFLKLSKEKYQEHYADTGRYAFIASGKMGFMDAAFLTVPKLVVHKYLISNNFSAIFQDGLRVAGLTISILVLLLLTLVGALISGKYTLSVWSGYIILNIFVALFLHYYRSQKRKLFMKSF